MKKLMIAAALICAAVVSQAAKVDWSITSITDKNGSSLSSGAVYTFCTKGDSATKIADVQAALLAATDVASFTEALNSAGYLSALSGTASSGAFSKSGVDLATSGVPGDTKTTKLFAVILDTTTITDQTNWYITENSNGVWTPDASTLDTATFSVVATTSATPENWHAVAVPEPTSGLLLLLGMAGLALRRRRA